jgi:hypothetical protein
VKGSYIIINEGNFKAFGRIIDINYDYSEKFMSSASHQNEGSTKGKHARKGSGSIKGNENP